MPQIHFLQTVTGASLGGLVSPGYAAPTLAGLLLIALAGAVSLMRKEIAVSGLLALVFGGALTATNVISSLKASGTNFEIDTRQLDANTVNLTDTISKLSTNYTETTTKLSTTLDGQAVAIKSLNDGLAAVSSTLKDVVQRQSEVVSQLPEAAQKNVTTSSVVAPEVHLAPTTAIPPPASIKNLAPLNLSIQQQLSNVKPLTRQ